MRSLVSPLISARRAVAPGVSRFARAFSSSGGIEVGKLPVETRLFINNEFCDGVGAAFDTINPATEEVNATVQEAGKADVDRAVKAAHKAFDSWSCADPAFRRDCLNRLADLVMKHADQLADIESRDNGKPRHIARHVDIPLVANVFRYYAGWADKIQGKSIPLTVNSDKYLAFTRHEPVGVVGQIIPWNFPLAMFSWKIGPAMATGCTTVLKTSEKTPVTGAMMGHLVREAGFPEGVINILSGWGTTTGHQIAVHPLVDKLAFTGSTKTAMRILEASRETGLKRTSLELGGKSPLIVFKDADLDQALDIAELGLFFNQGQCCIASSRIFIEESVYDQFCERAKERAEKRIVGDPFDPKTTQGPQVDRVQFDRVMDFIDSGKSEGATLLAGGNRHGSKGFFVQPTIFKDVKDDMKIAREEIFGPVMQLMKFKTVDEAIARANASEYGLGAGVATRDIGRALQVAKKLRAGTVYVNCYDVFDPAAPFGGFKDSGIGRELGEYGLEPYTEVKTVICDLSHK